MSPITAPRGMVATPHPAATEAGIEALRAGGTAVDAAVAANAMLAVVYGNACGIGGDAFALVWDPAEAHLYGFNGSGRSPAGLSIERVRGAGHETMPQRGPFTVNVPGAVDAWAQLLDRFGRRSLADALLPAADVAERGYQLTRITAGAIQASLPWFDDAARRCSARPAVRATRSGSRSSPPRCAPSPTAVATPTTAGQSATRSRAPSRRPAAR
jgi:gamma-glutamyltranspeptidase / glutathione hydrolase